MSSYWNKQTNKKPIIVKDQNFRSLDGEEDILEMDKIVGKWLI